MITSFPEALLHAPAVHPCPEHDSGDVRALFLQSVPYRGRETRAFAYYGLPRDHTEPCPGMVLLHGGGGTAFHQWVRLWNARGYAALALDLEGHLPLKAEPAHVELTQHPHSGPARQGDFADVDEPVTDQWMYHAIAAAMVGVSFLRAQPEVNATQVGVNGISWGGMVASKLLCVDTRLAFAVPVYGCGFLRQGHTYFAPVFEQEKVRALWDCSEALSRCTTPTLWLNGARDMHFSPDSTSLCHTATPGSAMLLLPGLGHGYDGAGWEVEEVYAFADTICGKGTAFTQFTKPFDGQISLPDGVSIASAVQWTAPQGLCYPDPERQCATEWENEALEVSGNRVCFRRPSVGAVSFVNVTDSLGRTVSSPVFGANIAAL